jgi:acyl-CoA reductase-like NAD-dependent aldehyde dehydrogenase
VRVLEEIADSEEADPADRIRAVDVLARYGLGAASDVSVDQVRERLARTVALLRARIQADLARAIIHEMREIWLT